MFLLRTGQQRLQSFYMGLGGASFFLITGAPGSINKSKNGVEITKYVELGISSM